VAAHLDPEVLLIDEVLSVGDLAFQEKCYERMQRFARSGIAIVFVSHNLSAISTLCSRVMVLRHGEVQTLSSTHHALTVYATLVQEARVAAAGRQELVLQVIDVDRRPVSEVSAGNQVRVRCTGHPPPPGGLFHTELQVRHLETGMVIYRCQSQNAGAPPVRVEQGEALETEWLIDVNLGRGHYALTCALLNEHHRWLAVSNPALLTVNERDSEQGVVYLAPTCSARAVAPGIPQSALAPAASRS
jgi:energy-coupling factor transporter ATP-binding protein EcfA2